LKTFRQAVQSDRFSISADLTLQSSTGPDDVARQVDMLAPLVDGVQVTDNPWAWVQMSAISAASLVIKQGLDPIPILTCRDRNQIALQSDLLGLRAMGVTSVLLMRGHKVPDDHSVKAKTVFDTSGRDLVAMAAGLDDLDPPAPGKEFFIGVGARLMRPQKRWKAESLQQRSAAGAQFLQTQLCFNVDILREYMQNLIEKKLTWKYSVVVSLTPLPSATTAKWLKNNLTDSRIPEFVIERLEKASDSEAEGIALCGELIREISEVPGVSGVNLMTVGNPDSICQAIKASGLR
jgi:methylenetetrahydrofolate reductase (NADPH)